MAGSVSSSGSAGTLGFGYFHKEQYPASKLVAAEALQCPTLLYNGYGEHRIEGIGDKHIPWIHDCKNTDMVISVDDEAVVRFARLFNERKGRDYLVSEGVDPEFSSKLGLLGISCIGNLVAAIKFAKYYELGEEDWVVTIFTDSMELYHSRIEELVAERGEYTQMDACRDYQLFMDAGLEHLLELGYYDRKRIHNLKYFTWIEQQGREVSELNDQWQDHHNLSLIHISEPTRRTPSS